MRGGLKMEEIKVKSKRGRKPKKPMVTLTALERLKEIVEQQKSLAEEAEKLKKEVEFEKYKAIYDTVAESGLENATDAETLKKFLGTLKYIKDKGFRNRSELEAFFNLHIHNTEEHIENKVEENIEVEEDTEMETEENEEENTFNPTPFTPTPFTPTA